MASDRYDCLCAGIVVADHVCDPVDHVPAPGELVLSARMELSIGGCASNVAVDLAKLGCRTTVAGKIGRDVFGRFIRDSLAAAGVHCGHLGESPSTETSGTLVINTRGEDRRFIHTVGANAEFDGSEVTPELIRCCRTLYLGGYCLSEQPSAERVAAVFHEARRADVTTVLDVVIPGPGDWWPRLRPVLPVTDVFLPNEDEARLITGLDDPLEQAQAFHRAGAKTVVVTGGRNGAVLVSDAMRLRAAAYPIEFVDGTGSGDAFAAGYVYGLLKHAGAMACLRYGSALGASCVRGTGATTQIFTAEELEAFVAEHRLPISELAGG